jgi:hypothetical protein
MLDFFVSEINYLVCHGIADRAIISSGERIICTLVFDSTCDLETLIVE